MTMLRGVLSSACLLLVSVGAYAQGTVTSGGAAYVIAASHWDSSPAANFTGVGTGDQLFEAGWFFRIEGDAAETPFPTPDAQNYTGNVATITWANMSTRNLAVNKTITVTSGGAGTGEAGTTVAVTNNGGAAITLHLFHIADFDVNGSATGDNATLVQANNYIRVTDATTGACEYRAPGAVAYAVRAWDSGNVNDVPALLGNASVNNLDNTGLPFGPGDFTGGFQWTAQVAPGATTTVQVYTACNQVATPVSLQRFEID